MRPCEFCHVPLTIKPRENPCDFAARRFCDRACADFAKDGLARTLHMADVGRIYRERAGRKAPQLHRVLEEVRAELSYIQAQQGRRG